MQSPVLILGSPAISFLLTNSPSSSVAANHAQRRLLPWPSATLTVAWGRAEGVAPGYCPGENPHAVSVLYPRSAGNGPAHVERKLVSGWRPCRPVILTVIPVLCFLVPYRGQSIHLPRRLQLWPGSHQKTCPIGTEVALVRNRRQPTWLCAPRYRWLTAAGTYMCMG